MTVARELVRWKIVAQANKVGLIGQSRKKDDRLNARSLARLAHIDPELLGPIQHRSARAQADLIMIRQSRTGGSADGLDQCGAGLDEVLWGTVAGLQSAKHDDNPLMPMQDTDGGGFTGGATSDGALNMAHG